MSCTSCASSVSRRVDARSTVRVGGVEAPSPRPPASAPSPVSPSSPAWSQRSFCCTSMTQSSWRVAAHFRRKMLVSKAATRLPSGSGATAGSRSGSASHCTWKAPTRTRRSPLRSSTKSSLSTSGSAVQGAGRRARISARIATTASEKSFTMSLPRRRRRRRFRGGCPRRPPRRAASRPGVLSPGRGRHGTRRGRWCRAPR